MKTPDVPFIGDPDSWPIPVQRSIRLSNEDWWKAASIAEAIDRDRAFVLRKLIRHLYSQLFDLSPDGRETPIGTASDRLRILEHLGLR